MIRYEFLEDKVQPITLVIFGIWKSEGMWLDCLAAGRNDPWNENVNNIPYVKGQSIEINALAACIHLTRSALY